MRVNQLSGMRQILIQAEGGAFLWVFGYKPKKAPTMGLYPYLDNLTGKEAFLSVPVDALRKDFSATGSLVKSASAPFAFYSTKAIVFGSTVYAETYIPPYSYPSVYGIDKNNVFRDQLDPATGYATGYIDFLKTSFWVGEQPGETFSIQTQGMEIGRASCRERV